MDIELTGIFPAVPSPCDEQDRFVEDQFAALITSLYRDGVHGLYICGATGEGYHMRLDERQRAVEIGCQISSEFNGTVIAHVGALNTRDAVELASHAAQTGVAAVASMPPANRSQVQLVDYYSAIAGAAQIPVLVYHIPALTQHTPTLDEMLALVDIEGVVGLKFTDWNLLFLKRLLLARPDIVVLSGYDEILCPTLLYGAHGGIGSFYNLFPKAFLGIYQSVGAGDIRRAMALQNRLLSFLDIAHQYGIGPLFEFLMIQRGFGPHCFRRPRTVIDSDTLKRMKPELNARIAAIEEIT